MRKAWRTDVYIVNIENTGDLSGVGVCEEYKEITDYLEKINAQNILVVCGSSVKRLRIDRYINKLECGGRYKITRFSDFKPNPEYESVVRGVKVLNENSCDTILAVGGGSAMDVAKCIKLYSNMDSEKNYLEQEIVPNDVHIMAVPTTAGTGSEATKYAVIYYEGSKQSISDCSCIPEAVFMDASVLETLPLYQKKATMMDAMCHSIEAYWSVNSTKESKEYSKKAIELILENMELYLGEDKAGENVSPSGTQTDYRMQSYFHMLYAAYFAGKAINITQTTAGHAMCYKLTGIYGISHGHGAALCVRRLWRYMALEAEVEKCIDSRGGEYLKKTFEELAQIFGGETIEDGVKIFERICDRLELGIPNASEEEIHILTRSVNPVRLKNNPVKLDTETIERLYRRIVTCGMEDSAKK